MLNYTRNYTDVLLKRRQVLIVKNWAPAFKSGFEEKIDFSDFFKSDIIV